MKQTKKIYFLLLGSESTEPSTDLASLVTSSGRNIRKEFSNMTPHVVPKLYPSKVKE